MGAFNLPCGAAGDLSAPYNQEDIIQNEEIERNVKIDIISVNGQIDFYFGNVCITDQFCEQITAKEYKEIEALFDNGENCI